VNTILRQVKFKQEVAGKREIADYVLVYKGIKLAVVEAKSDELEVGEGVMQAKQYAEKLKLETTYSTNGKEIYQHLYENRRRRFGNRFSKPRTTLE
jgi:type I site-specific restriction endonuclease